MRRISTKNIGVKYIVVTDIARDGSLTMPSWEMYEKISGINFVVSGGVANEEHIKFAAAQGYYATIVGKAYYEGRVDLEKCIKELSHA